MDARFYGLSFRDAAGSVDESFGIIYSNHLIGNAAQFESETSYGAANVESANEVRAWNGQQAFPADAFVKAE